MAGFVDVSALLQRKTFSLDVTPGKSGEEAQSSGGFSNGAGSEKDVLTKPVSEVEQRPEVKLPPRSPKSALSLQASPVGTSPSSKILAQLARGVTSNASEDTNVTKGSVDDVEGGHVDLSQGPNVGRILRTGDTAEAAFETSNEKKEQGSEVANRVPSAESTSSTGNASESERSLVDTTRTGVKSQAPVRELSLPERFEDAVDGFEEGVSVSRTTSVESASMLKRESARPSLPSSSLHLQEGREESPLGNQHKDAAIPREALNVLGNNDLQNEGKALEDENSGAGGGLTSPGKGSGRLSKVGGLLKKTLTFTRSKSGESNEQAVKEGEETTAEDSSEGGKRASGYPGTGEADLLQEGDKKADGIGKELDGADLAKNWLEAETRTLQDAERSQSGGNVPPIASHIEHPAPQVGRADSGRVRSLLRKLMPGGSDAAETDPPQVEERVIEPPVVKDATLPQVMSSGNVNDDAAGNLKEDERGVGGIEIETSAADSKPQGDSNVGSLMRTLSLKPGEDSGKTVQTQANANGIAEREGRLGRFAERASVFRIPKHMLPGQSGGGVEIQGADDPPARPLIVFVDSKVASEREAEMQLGLREILGGAQVFDVARRPAGDFLTALLSKLEQCARAGDHAAAAVKDSLRILVAGDDALLKSVTQALQESNAWKGIPVGCLAAGGTTHVSRVLGLGRGLSDVSNEAVFELLTQAADAGTQVVDCWEVTLSNHRKRTAANLPSFLERIPVEGAKGDWVLSHRGLCWGSMHLDMGYGAAHLEAKGVKHSPRQSGRWMCGLCSTSAPQVIRSQNVGRLEILKEGVWSYLELSPQIQSLEFVNLAEEQQKTRRKMRMLEKGLVEAYADDGLIEIVGVQEGSDTEICLAQTNAVRLELFGNAEIDQVKLRLDSESWDQPLAGETTADPAVVQITHGGRVPILVPPNTTLRCTVPPVFRPSVFAPPPAETNPPERRNSGLFRRRSPSPFRKGGRFRSPSPFRRKNARRSPSPPRSSLTPDPLTASASAPSTSEFAPPASESVRSASGSVTSASGGSGATGSDAVLLKPRTAPVERTFVSPRGKRRGPSPVPGRADREGRSGSADRQKVPGGNQNVPGVHQNAPDNYADAAAAAAKGLGGVSARRAGGSSVPWTLKADKLVDVEKVQPQQKLGRSGSGRQEIVEPVAKTLVRTGSGRLDEHGRPPSPALYRSSSRDNLDQAVLSRPASPALYRSSSRENLEQAGGLSRPPSPGLARQSSGNTGYSPRGTIAFPPRSESPVLFRERDPTPERLPRMADWATGMSRKSTSMTYSPGVHSHLLTKQEREHAVAIGLGSTLTREERERMQALAFGNSSGYSGYDRATSYSGYDRATTPQRIRSARARYIGAATPMYQVRGPLELDLATSNEADSPPPPVRTARDYFSGPLTPNGVSLVRRSTAS